MVLTISTETAGTNNLILGSTAGDSIASGGNQNTCIGDSSGTAITTGDRNVLLDLHYLKLQQQHHIVIVGYQALENNTGNNNTAVGDQALEACNFAINNTAVGDDAGLAITTGIFNTIMGVSAGDALQTLTIMLKVSTWWKLLSTLNSAETEQLQYYHVKMGQNHTSSTDNYNVAVGYTAGNNMSTGNIIHLCGGTAGDANILLWNIMFVLVMSLTQILQVVQVQ